MVSPIYLNPLLAILVLYSLEAVRKIARREDEEGFDKAIEIVWDVKIISNTVEMDNEFCDAVHYYLSFPFWTSFAVYAVE